MVEIKKCLGLYSLLWAVGVNAGEAPVIKDNPRKAVYRADLDNAKTHGIIEFTAKNGTTKVKIDVTGLPETGGPFYYHIHSKPVPANGNCDGTGLHLNPYDAPADNCDDFDNDAFCQVGDLSGKHGYINTTCFQATYYDPYLSLNPKDDSYIGGLSVTMHYANMERFVCGNIVQVSKKFEADDEDEDEDEAVAEYEEQETFFKRHVHPHEYTQEQELEDEEKAVAEAAVAPNVKERYTQQYPNKTWNSSHVAATTTEYCDGASALMAGSGIMLAACIAYLL